jgi:hypothetical protein
MWTYVIMEVELVLHADQGSMQQQVLSTLRQKQCNFPNCATCTQTSYQGVSRSTLGSHKQRTRVRLHQFWLCWLYLNLVVHRKHLSPGHTGSTSTASRTTSTRLPAALTLHQLRRAPRLLVSRLHELYLNLVKRRLDARLLVSRSHWLSPCVRSLRLATRLLVVRIAPALLRIYRASERAVARLLVSQSH